MLGRALPITVWSSAESINTSEMPSMANKACLKVSAGWLGVVMSRCSAQRSDSSRNARAAAFQGF
ncbi:hypothetical protein A249_33026, partial [Pseudomonas syringae pv. actinidiae ICMP 18804]